MKSTRMRVLSAVTTLALLAGTAGAASLASIASADTPQVTAQAATNITTSGATLNAMNGSADATGSAFWVSTSSAAMSGLASSSSPTLPAGVYSTGDLGAVASSTAFTSSLGALSIPSGFSASANTTYYVAAWVNIGGVWYPSSVVNFMTAAATSTPTTTVSNVTVSNVGTSTATISWNTNNASTGTVNFGTTTGYGTSVTTTGSASTTQSVTLTNLNQGTLYHFSVTGTDGTTSATSSDMTFMTGTDASSTPLAVTGVDAVKTNATADNTYADGWQWVMHLTVPTTEDAFRIKFSDWTMGSSSTSFPTANNMEVYSPQSSNASTSATAVTSTDTGYGGWLYLNGDADPATPGRQIDVNILVKVPVGTAAGNYTTTYTAQSWASNATSTAI